MTLAVNMTAKVFRAVEHQVTSLAIIATVRSGQPMSPSLEVCFLARRVAADDLALRAGPLLVDLAKLASGSSRLLALHSALDVRLLLDADNLDRLLDHWGEEWG